MERQVGILQKVYGKWSLKRARNAARCRGHMAAVGMGRDLAKISEYGKGLKLINLRAKWLSKAVTPLIPKKSLKNIFPRIQQRIRKATFVSCRSGQTSEKKAETISNGDDWTKTNEYRKLWSRIYPKVLAECLRGSGRNNRLFRHEIWFYELSWLLLLPRVSLQYFHKYEMLFSTLAKTTVVRGTDTTYLLFTTVYETFTCSMFYKIYENSRKRLLTQQHSGNSSHIGERRKPGTATGQDYGLNYKWSHVVWIRLSPNIKQASRGYNTSSHKAEGSL